jgi:hypothetical protein
MIWLLAIVIGGCYAIHSVNKFADYVNPIQLP